MQNPNDKIFSGYRGFTKSVQIYTRPGPIIVDENCFSFQFTNVGSTVASIDDMVIFPSATPATAIGDSRTISGHEGDLYLGSMNLKFTGAVVNPGVEIVQLSYTGPTKLKSI